MRRRVLHQLGWGDTKALLLACPPYVLAAVASVSLAWSSGRLHERTWHATAAFAVAIVGFATAATTVSQVGRYIACFIFPAGTYAVNSVIVAWVGTTLSQSPEKKSVSGTDTGRLPREGVCFWITDAYVAWCRSCSP